MIRILPFRVPYLDNLGARNSSTLTQHDFDSYLNFLLFELDFLGKYINIRTHLGLMLNHLNKQIQPMIKTHPCVFGLLVLITRLDNH